ncbi:MAG: TonB-dependent receptor [Arcobacteraceae bacterium]|jgi:vitamin B12 transporter|nr:TonB-dependent receptor [Arcobacteraceae bacterium]MDY0365587.1 TonB-dependent receptor [Arcobacteraceae bacterium]
MKSKFKISLATCLVLTSFLEGSTIEVSSASKSNQSIKDITSNIEIITGSELEEKHITTLIEAMRSIGIPMAQSGGIGQQSSFFLRGFASENIIVLIDGISYNDPTTTKSQAQLEHIMISDIEQIEIIKGAQSGIWGANAVAGVINIITKKPTNTLSSNASVEYGSNSTKKYSFSLSQRINKLSFYLGGNLLKTDGISAYTPQHQSPKDYEKDGYTNKTLNAKLNYDIDEHNQIGFNTTLINAKADYDGGWPIDPNSDGYQMTQQNRLYGVNYLFNQDDLAINAKYNHTSFNKKDPLGWTPIFRGAIDNYRLDTRYNYIENSFFLIGIEKNKSKDKESTNLIKNKSIYATNSNSFDKLIITESLRYDNYNKFSNHTTGKLGAKYLFNEDFDISSNYGLASRAPSLFELYDAFSGNENLELEKTKSFDIGFRYKGFELTYFDNITKNLIDYVPTSPWTGNYDQVEGKTKIKGYEAKYTKEIFQDLYLGARYNTLNAKDRDGDRLARRAKDSFGLNIDYYGLAKTHIGVYASYIGSRYDEKATTNQTGKYTTFDSVVNYDINDTVKLYLKADNITNKRYQEVLNYGTFGRTYLVGLNAKF